MKIDSNYQLTYCTNIHPGETWSAVFRNLKDYVPVIGKNLAGDQPFAIGLRLSDLASRQLLENNQLQELKSWLETNNFYVFTFNGFPYGGFHRQTVKDEVHQPDWTTPDRLAYTKRLFDILAALLPDDQEGGVSTSPLSYKLWHRDDQAKINEVFKTSTEHLVEIALHLKQIKEKSGKLLHLDIEPEPDGLLENSKEVVAYFNQWLIPIGSDYLVNHLGISKEEAEESLREHIQICYDVCHFAVAFEEPETVFNLFQKENIKIGKVQISAALKAEFPKESADRQKIKQAFETLVESTYLHQVVEKRSNGSLVQYNDLPVALAHFDNQDISAWRTHFHVPIFVKHYGILASTQEDIVKVIALLKNHPYTQHLEAETYTWEVLPNEIKLNLADSITRELSWVTAQFNKE